MENIHRFIDGKTTYIVTSAHSPKATETLLQLITRRVLRELEETETQKLPADKT